MTMNFMDYTNDACMFMFTFCQANIMVNTLNNQREILLENSFCNYSSLENFNLNKKIIKVIDILGRDCERKDFFIEIYDDGSIKKNYLSH